MARTISYMQAINEALAQEMERDETVVVFGEDNVGGAGSPGEMDAWGGVMGVTKGLLIASIRDDDPVMFFENKVLYAVEGDVPEEPYAIPLGEAEYVREGDDVTIVAIGRMVSMAEQAAASLADEGIECEIVDPRTTSPLDEETIFESVENTGRLVVVDEANPRCSLATDIAARVAENCFDDLKAAPKMVTAPHTPPPFSPSLEDLYVPDPDRIAEAAREVAGAGVSETQRISKLGMPKWGLSMTEGTVVEWLLEEGTELAKGDEVVEVESEKINNAIESPAEGVLRRRVATEGEVLPVGGLLGVIAPSDVPDEEIDSYVEEFLENFDPELAAAEAGGPEPQTVEIGGRNVQYLKIGEGEGPPLILLHGFGGDINIWVFNQEALSETGRTVYALDLPGHGQSSKDVGEGDLDSFVGVLAGFMDEMGVEKAHLVGHSMGGAVAGSFALAHRERVASLVLVDSAGLGEEINEDYIEGFIAANRRREMKNVLGLLFANPDLVTRRLVNDELRFKRMDGVDKALRAVADKMFPDGSQADGPDLSGLDVSILAIWGQDDQIIPVSHTENLPDGARVEILEEAGHMPQMESAGRTNRLIEGFLDNIE